MDYPFPHQTKETLKRFGMLPYQSHLVPSSEQIQQLHGALVEDAQSYLYNGIISFGAAVQSIGTKNYGWAVVKLYYSVFYLARAKLAIGSQKSIVYDVVLTKGKEKTKPYLVSLPPNDILQQQTIPSTHKLILRLLPKHFPNNSLANSQVGKDNMPVLDWLMKQRECANYTSVRMPDPEPPEILKKIIEGGDINKWLETYKQDLIYVTDEEHVCLAYPFLLLLDILEDFKNQSVNCYVLRDNLHFIENLLTEDNNKNLDVLLSDIRECL